MKTILAIESSCDDTAAAVIHNGKIQCNVISSQDLHADFGGVVPELASRDHQRHIVPVVQQALEKAGISMNELDAIAATRGPGLSGSLLVGLSFGKSLAMSLDVPFIGINHIEAHLYSVKIEEPSPNFPYLCLVVSGGHTELVLVEEGFQHTVLGKTRDDAAGEAFDKAARLFELGYPGGPEIDRLAQKGNPDFHDFPRSRPGDFDFSFSGLKTSLLYYLNDFDASERERLFQSRLPDLCASFQEAIVSVLVDVVREAASTHSISDVAIAGGVSANTRLRELAAQAGSEDDFSVYLPAMEYCMDNAAMIAQTAWYKAQSGQFDTLTTTVDPKLAL